MYTGLIGSLKVADAFGGYRNIAYINGWSVEEKSEMIDCSEFGEADKKSIAGAKSWSASANGTICFDSAGGHDDLFETHYRGKPLLFRFYLSDSGKQGAEEDTYLCGTGYIESMSMDLSAEDRGTISLSVSGVGPLELFVNGKNVVSDREHRVNDAISLYVDSDRHLYAVVPDALDESCVWVDEETGRLFIRFL